MTRSARFAGILGLFLPLLISAQDIPAPAQAAEAPSIVQPEPEQVAIVQVAGVETLVDYAAVGRLLGALEGVRRVDVTEAASATVTFRVLVRGGSEAIDRALANSSQFIRSAASGGRLAYEYRR